MDSDEPLFEVSFKRWPPIYRYKSKISGQKTSSTANIVSQRAATPPEHSSSNLVRRESTQPNQPTSVPLPEQGTGPSSSSSEPSNAAPLMNPYPISIPVSLNLPALSNPTPVVLHPQQVLVPPHPQIIHNGVAFPAHPPPPPPPPLPPPNQTPPAILPAPAPIGNPSMGVTPAAVAPIPTPPLPSMNTPIPAAIFTPLEIPFVPNMGGAVNRGITGEFPPLHSLPPSFWEPVVPHPEPEPAPPMHTPAAPSLQDLAVRPDGNGENFSDDRLKAIIIKAQPHHSNETLAHLNRDQLVKHVNDLVDWWKRANPQQAQALQTQASPSLQQEQQSQHAMVQARHEQRLQQVGAPPTSPAVQAAADSVADEAKAQEKVIGQCPCCYDAQQNAAFSPCGHLYACDRCAHRLYDGGRGKCPVCRTTIHTYLKIYATA